MSDMKKITQLLSDQQLIEAIDQIREDEKTGIIRSGGFVRVLAEQLKTYIKVGTLAEWLKVAEDNLNKEAADRFVKLKTNL